MGQLGFLHLILLYTWPTSIKKKKHQSLTWERGYSALRRLKTYVNSEHGDVPSVKQLRACSLSQDNGWHNRPRCDRQDVRKRKRTKEGAFWEVQVDVDSSV